MDLNHAALLIVIVAGVVALIVGEPDEQTEPENPNPNERKNSP